MKLLVDRFKDALPEEVGAKAQNLFLLKRYFAVPKFSVITTANYRYYKKHGKISQELDKELRRIFKTMLKKGPIAIRSSCTTEDMPGISFAGMYTTFLNVDSIESAVKAVVRTWDSTNNERVKEYCKNMGIHSGDMAVIIQEQLNPELSGVMVTQSPFSVSEMMIECCQGLGEKLVSGKIIPSRYKIKNEKVKDQKGKGILSRSEVYQLVDTGNRIEKILGSPQDIEWAIEDGKLFVLQSRPIYVPEEKPKKKGKVWCNANVRETIPGPISPMMFSIFESIMFPMIIIDAFGVPISREQYHKYPAVERVLGRLYWNVNNTMALGRTIDPIMRLLNADKNLDPQMAVAFKYVDIVTLPKLIPFLRSLWFSFSAMVRMTFFIIKGSIFMRSTVDKIYDVLYETLTLAQSYQLSSDMKRGIITLRKLIENIGSKISRRYFGGIFLSLFYVICLGKILSLRCGKKGEAIARKTTIGLIDKTGEMIQAIERLANYARIKKHNNNINEVRKLWREDAEFQRIFNAFIIEFGHRGPAEFDVANLNWREDYDLVFQLIATHTKSALKQVRSDLVKEIIDNARPFERFFIKLFLPRISAFTSLRENGKHYYFKATAKVKDQLLMFGEYLVKNNYFNDIRDVFLLELKDLTSITSGEATPAQIRELIGRRKRERAEYEMIDAPDIVFEDGSTLSLSAKPGSGITGEPVSFGRVKGRARIIKDFKSSVLLKPGEILVTHHTDPGWTPLFSIASGVIIEVGGLICHAAMVARELGIPTVVVGGATKLINDGQLIELNADEGIVRIIDQGKM